MPSVHGEDAVIRILDKESISEQFHELRLDILGFPEDELQRFRKYIAEPYGMVLVTGPTGTGKTTTLYAALSEIKSIEDKIITIEDPVEYQLRGITQIPINEKKGLTFARGLRSILRHDPDKIMVGEIRDPETAQIAIQVGADRPPGVHDRPRQQRVDVLGRFLNMGVEPYQFVSALNCVLAQRLVRNICMHCKRPAKVTRELLEVGARPGARRQRPVLRGARLHRVRRHRLQGPDGDLRAARPDRQHPRDDPRAAAHSEIKKAARDEGMRFLRESAVEQVLAGIDDAARDQQGDLRRMSPSAGSASPPPPAASRSRRAACTAVAIAAGGAADRRRARRRAAAARRRDAGARRHRTFTTPRRSRRAVAPFEKRAAAEARSRWSFPDAAAKVSLRAVREGPGARRISIS